MRSSTFRLELLLCMKPSNSFKGILSSTVTSTETTPYKSRNPSFRQGRVVTLPWFYPLKSCCYHTTCLRQN